MPTTPPRALVLSHTAEPGGAERYLADLVTGSASWTAGFLADGPTADRLRAAGERVVVVPSGDRLQRVGQGTSWRAGLAGAVGVVATARRLARVARDHDVLVANSQKALPVALAAGLLARRPVVWVLHDLMTDPAFSAVNVRAAVLLARRARLVGVNSTATGTALVAVGGRADRVRVVPNGFDPDVPRPGAAAAAALRAAADLDERPVVGLFGRIAPWKGQDVLLRALPALPAVQAVLVGGALFGAEDHRRSLETLAEELGVVDRVRFLGHRDDVPALMAGVDAVVHCSTVPEPFGRVLVEAQLAGRPVVATAGGGVGEVVEHERTGLLVAPGDPAALADAVRRVLAEPGLAGRLAAAGRARSAERYSLAAARGAFAALLDEAVARA